MAQAVSRVSPEELHKTDTDTYTDTYTDRSSESDEEDSNLVPYHFEPEASSESDSEDVLVTTEEEGVVVVKSTTPTTTTIIDRTKLGSNKDWCKCGYCQVNYNKMECVCCIELEKSKSLIDEYNLGS